MYRAANRVVAEPRHFRDSGLCRFGERRELGKRRRSEAGRRIRHPRLYGHSAPNDDDTIITQSGDHTREYGVKGRARNLLGSITVITKERKRERDERWKA